MKRIKLLLLLALPAGALSQATFLKLYPNPDGYDVFKEMVQVSAGEYAFITGTFFYRIDQQGKVLLKKDLQTGQSTFLESLVKDNAGNFYIAAQVFTTVSDPNMVLYKLNSNGQVLVSKTFATGSTNRLRMISAPNSRLFITYIHTGAGIADHLDVLLLDGQGQEVWKKELPHKVYNDFAAHATPNGQVELLFLTQGDYTTRLLQVDEAGTLSEKEILLPQPATVRLYTRDFCRTPDGGYVFSGETLPADLIGDALLYKTDKDGKLQWKREININLRDRFMGIAIAADGYVLMADAGFTEDWGNDVAGDLVLVKTDWQGHVQWKKALGSAKADYGSQILLPDANSLLIGGRVSYPGQVVPVPMICKTDNQGNLPSTLPFQPVPPTTFKKMQVNDEAPVQRLAKVLPAPGGALITGSNFQHKTDHRVYPYLCKTDKTGQPVWNKKLTAAPGIIRALTPTLDGHYMGLVEQRGFLGINLFTLVKFRDDGDTLWTAPVSTSVLRDMIATSDGGYLLVGSEDLTLSDYDVVLIKTDARGKELWRKKTGIPARWETARRIMETPEHDFIIAGNSQKAFDAVSSAYALKIDKEGNVLWSKTFDAGIAVNVLQDVAITNDHGYIMTGYATLGAGDQKDILLIRLNKQGDKLWEKTYDLHLQDEGLSVHYTAEDTLLIAGNTGEPGAGKLEKYGFLLTLNKDGNKERVQYFGAEGVQTSVEKILISGDEVVLAGNTQEEYGKGHMYFIKAGTAPPAGQPATGSLVIYPNPTHSKVFISMKNNYTGPTNIVLYNTTGQQVMVLQRTKTSFELKEEVPLNNLSSGMYYFFIQQGNDRTVKRLEIVNR